MRTNTVRLSSVALAFVLGSFSMYARRACVGHRLSKLPSEFGVNALISRPQFAPLLCASQEGTESGEHSVTLSHGAYSSVLAAMR